MKANELRIGNLVTDSIGIVEIGENAKIEFCDIYNPIPLTEEWLLKFGFKSNGEWFVVNTFETEFTELNINPKIHRATISEGDVDNWDEMALMNGIKYVHQLQNLYFALTGEELTLSE